MSKTNRRDSVDSASWCQVRFVLSEDWLMRKSMMRKSAVDVANEVKKWVNISTPIINLNLNKAGLIW